MSGCVSGCLGEKKAAEARGIVIFEEEASFWLDGAGKEWLTANPDKIEIHRLPPYSPEFNPTEGAWKATRKLATHNRFYRTVEERDGALTATFEKFRSRPELISPQVVRFR